MPTDTSFVAEFRRRIQDTRCSKRALSVFVSDASCTSAVAEITRGHLILTVAGGVAPSLDLDLTNPRYDTIGALYETLSRTPGMSANLDEDANPNHLSIDLEPFGPLSIKETGATLQHHMFSDSELEELLRDATRRHNPSFTLLTLPPQEWPFVLPLAQAGMCRLQAMDAAKRKGLDKDVPTLLQLADSFERQYNDDVARLARSISSPKEANPNLMDEGDVVLGSQFRQSLRTGYMSPLSKTITPDAAVLYEPDVHDIEDDNVRIIWQRNQNADFYSYELWMDTQPEVTRRRDDLMAATPLITPEDTLRSAQSRQSSSVLVYRSLGPNAGRARATWSTFIEEMGQLVRSFAIGALESESTYYFRLFIVNINYVMCASNIVKATTKTLRARFRPLAPNLNRPTLPYGPALDVSRGPAATVVTAQLDQSKGIVTTAHRLSVGGKQISFSILSDYSLSFSVPTFENVGVKDLVITSPTGLIDVLPRSFTVTA